jgi:vacuolar-type H+-ATPase subunit E/Vma4
MAKDDDDYKFPDEIDEKSKGKPDDDLEISYEVDDDDIKIEIEDDTPPEDRHVQPLTDEVKDDLERADESKDYSHNVKTKFKQYKKAWHDERRAKESAYREQQEALQIAQNILEENKKLKGMLQKGETELIDNYKTSAELEVDKAERNYKEAYDMGDADKLLEAQKELMRAEMKLDKAKNFKPTVQIPENEVQTTQKQPAQQQMDPKVSAWVSENQWFVNPNKRGMRRYAEGVHEELAERYGQAFVGTDEYFKGIDKEVRKRFPEEFASEQNVDDDKPQRTRPSTVVAPAKRSTAPKKITLSKTQVGVAKKLGISPEQYARELAKMEN